MMNLDFSGKTAIVTGGTRGIGKSIAAMLLDCGAEVVYTGTKPEATHTLTGGRYIQLDLTDRNSITQFTKHMIAKMPQLDILINNAGINLNESIDTIEDAHWDKILQVNLTGAMMLMREAGKKMKQQDSGGRILNVSSIWGMISKSKRGSYSASKTGLIGLTRAVALDLAPCNILVNAICPGFTKTELTSAMLSPNEMRALAGEVPLQRFAEVDEIARVALFLCSDFNTYITGQAIAVDGGFTVR